MVNYGVKQATEVISQMTSVERVLQFTDLPKEKTDGPAPPQGWPQRARLVFKDLYLRYDKDAEPVLKNLNIVIESGWKVSFTISVNSLISKNTTLLKVGYNTSYLHMYSYIM